MNRKQNRILGSIVFVLVWCISASAQIEGAKTQREAAQQLIDAWKAKNRTAASRLATRAVVKDLWSFSASGTPEENPNVRCTGKTNLMCSYGYMDQDGFAINMKFSKRSGKYYVSFIKIYVD